MLPVAKTHRPSFSFLPPSLMLVPCARGAAPSFLDLSFFLFFFSSRHSVLALDEFHAACKLQGLDFSECLRGGSGQWLAWGGASPWRLEDTGGGGAQWQRSLQTRFFDLEMTQPALLMNFNLLHLMCGALCCSQSATAHLYPPQTYSTVDDLFADSIFKVKSSRTEQPEGQNKNKSDY